MGADGKDDTRRRGLTVLVLAGLAMTACTSGSDAVEAPGAVATTVAPEPETTAAPTTIAPATTAAPTTIAPATTAAPTTTAASTSTTTVPESTVPPSTAAPGPFYRQGDEGPEIAVIQLKLQTVGFLDAGYAEGVFDGATNRAVLDFQGQYGLGVDGVVGPQTERALTAAAVSVNPESG